MKELCPAEALHEECGVFGIYDSTGKTNMVSAVYSALYALQHRGQESCGIALNVDGVLTGYRDLGLVSEVFTPRVLADLPQDAKDRKSTRLNSSHPVRSRMPSSA